MPAGPAACGGRCCGARFAGWRGSARGSSLGDDLCVGGCGPIVAGLQVEVVAQELPAACLEALRAVLVVCVEVKSAGVGASGELSSSFGSRWLWRRSIGVAVG